MMPLPSGGDTHTHELWEPFLDKIPRMYNLDNEEREFHESGYMYWIVREQTNKHIHRAISGLQSESLETCITTTLKPASQPL